MELLGYEFVQRGILAGLVVSVVSGVVGVFLVLRRLSFLGASLSHIAFGGVALGFLTGTDPFLFTLLISLLLSNLTRWAMGRVPGDALLALLFSAGASVAVLVLGVSEEFGEEVFGYLFGSVFLVSEGDLFLILLASSFLIGFLLLSYKSLLLTSFNEEVAKVKGVNVKLTEHMLVSAASVVVVLSVKVVGVVLTSSLIVVPALTSLMLARSFLGSLLLAGTLSGVCLLLGVFLSLLLDLPPSGTTVGLSTLLFFAVLLKKSLR